MLRDGYVLKLCVVCCGMDSDQIVASIVMCSSCLIPFWLKDITFL